MKHLLTPKRLSHQAAWALAVVALFSTARVSAEEPYYRFDPLLDTAITVAAVVFGAFSELTISGGELRAQTPGPIENLPGIDRWVAERDEFEEGARGLSDVGLVVLGSWALADAVISGFRDCPRAGMTDGFLYAEAMAINWALANLTKLAVRRPRPRAYWELRHGGAPSEDTSSALSFYSLHAAIAGSITGTATYLAFRRYKGGWKPWVTLAAGIALTTVVSIERVRALAHFPSDVVTGALFGAGVGVVVPHVHWVSRGRLALTPGAAGRLAGLSLRGSF